jgi:hypothetical protein
MMQRKSTEYSLAELLEHPVLRLQIANDGIESRSLDLIFDTVSDHQAGSGARPATWGGYSYPYTGAGRSGS